MSLSLEQVRHVAALARLALTPEEEQGFAVQLSAVLEHMASLSQVNTDGVEPTSHATLAESALRPDVVQPSLPPSRSLAAAAQRSGQSFAVPKILE